MLKIVTCSATNNSPAAYSVMKRRSRLMGLDTNISIEPLVKMSGNSGGGDYGQNSRQPGQPYTDADLHEDRLIEVVRRHLFCVEHVIVDLPEGDFQPFLVNSQTGECRHYQRGKDQYKPEELFRVQAPICFQENRPGLRHGRPPCAGAVGGEPGVCCSDTVCIK